MTDPRRERKIVTVLFADLVGFTLRAETLDPEDVEAILRPYHRRLRSELEQRGGTVEKFIGDAVMAVFGAPVAHEDDAERAVRAALAIRDGIVEDGKLEVRIGVNTGEALVSLDARPDAGEGMVAGDVVNTAARLQTAAPTNAVLVGESTQRATRQVIEYRAQESVEAKGKSEPLPVWEAVEARARVGIELRAASTPLVGREREREVLVGAFERSRSEQSTQLVTIAGVPGIGKSRLVAELYAELEREPDLTHWRQGRSLPYGEALPYAAFAEMVKAQAGILEGDTADEVEQKLAQAVAALAPEEPDWLTERLLPLLGAGGTPAERGDSFAAWRGLVEALAELRPTVLVFEDVQWADDDLLDFVDHLVDWVGNLPLLVVATARPELFERKPGWGGGKRNAATISLGPLGRDETAELLAALMERPVMDATTQSAVLERAEGNPLYAEQFARMVGERDDAVDLPETIQGIIAARLDALPAPEKQVLQDAAVVGRVFWLGALTSIAGIERAGAQELLHMLERKEFVRRERRGTVAGETEYAFAHVLLRDGAYAQIPRAARAEKHQRAAEWVESIAADERVDMLAHHYLSAFELEEAAGGDTDELRTRARTAVSQAAARAAVLKSFVSAVRLYTRALDLTSESDHEWPMLVLHKARALVDGGDAADLDALTAAADRFVAEGDVEHAAQAEVAAALSGWLLGDRERGDPHIERALELVQDAPASPAKAEVLVERSRLLMLGGDQTFAIELGEEGLAMAEALGLERLQASVLITIGTARGNLGDFDRGMEEVQRGLDLALRIREPQHVQRAYNNLVQIQARKGDYIDLLPVYDAAHRFAEEHGLPGGLRWIEMQHGMLSYEVGDWAAAECLDDILDTGAPHYLEGQARRTRALMNFARGDLDSALAEAERAVALTERARDPQAVGSVLSTYALLLLEDGRTQDAAEKTDEVLALRNASGGFAYFTWAVELAWLAFDLGRADAYREVSSREHPRTPWVEAGEAIVDGEFVHAADVLTRMGRKTDEAYARLRAAEQLAAEGRAVEAAEQRDEALAFYRSVGATTYIRRAEALLAASA